MAKSKGTNNERGQDFRGLGDRSFDQGVLHQHLPMLPFFQKLRGVTGPECQVAKGLSQTIVHLGRDTLAFLQGCRPFKLLVQVGIFQSDGCAVDKTLDELYFRTSPPSRPVLVHQE